MTVQAGLWMSAHAAGQVAGKCRPVASCDAADVSLMQASLHKAGQAEEGLQNAGHHRSV